MSTATKTLPITVEQYENFKGFPGLKDELIYGEIVMTPHAKPLHQAVAANIERQLWTLVEGTEYTVLTESNLKFTELHSMPSPDIYILSRVAFRRACEHDEYVAEPPLLTIEVLSPANRVRHVEQKVEIYLSAGVRAVWTVDLKKKAVTVHTGGKTVHDSGVINLPAPLPGEIKISSIFDLGF